VPKRDHQPVITGDGLCRATTRGREYEVAGVSGQGSGRRAGERRGRAHSLGRVSAHAPGGSGHLTSVVPDRGFAQHRHSRANGDVVSSSTKTSRVLAPGQSFKEPAPADCAFCKAAIRHAEHVPAARVRVGQDYGDAE